MALPAEKRRYSIQEYLEMEEKATDRHEFHDGEILAMSGGTYEHSRINTNLHIAIGTALKGKPCYPLDSNMRLRTPSGEYVYPDTSVVCGPAKFDPNDVKKTTIQNPRAIIEVLSDSTESCDRGAKFELYREIPSLQEYVLVSQREPLIETFLRQSDGAWLMRFWKGTNASAVFQSVQIDIPLSEIYAGVEFESAGSESPGSDSPGSDSM